MRNPKTTSLIFMTGLIAILTSTGEILNASSEAFSSTSRVKIRAVEKSLNQIVSISPEKRVVIAAHVARESDRTGISPEVMLAIMKVESDFNQGAVSVTQDLSIAQINYRVWSKEFARHGITLDRAKLKSDKSYAIHCMSDILKLLKGRHKSDRKWYVRYHSSTPVYADIYEAKLNAVFTQMGYFPVQPEVAGMRVASAQGL